MKNILICGVAKSGKSFLAEKICKNKKYNHIPIDYFTSSFKHNFPDIGITSDVIINKESSKKLSLYLSRIIEIMTMRVAKENFVIDTAHIYPEDIIKYIDLEKWDVYCLGYPNITAEDKLLNLRKYVHGGWCARENDENLKEILKQLIEISKKMELECEKYAIHFIDTSDFNNLLDLVENINSKK